MSNLWYFAHPYTCKDDDGNYVPAGEEANFRLCCIRSARLLQAGYNIYSPIAHSHPIHRACPEFLAAHEHDLWYRLDNDFIEHVDWAGIILAPGWKDSTGCRGELQLFEERGLPALLYGDAIASPVREAASEC